MWWSEVFSKRKTEKKDIKNTIMDLIKIKQQYIMLVEKLVIEIKKWF